MYKIFLAGEWKYDYYEKIVAGSLERLGHQVVPFEFDSYFPNYVSKIQRKLKLKIGIIKKLNTDLLAEIFRTKPDVVFLWRSLYVTADSIRILKENGYFVVTYNNDDPFPVVNNLKSNLLTSLLWRNYRDSLYVSDVNFVYRSKNVIELKSKGLTNVELLLPYYDPSRHYRIEPRVNNERGGIFIGHYEEDQRVECLEHLVDNNCDVSIYGTGWERMHSESLKQLLPVTPAYGDKYGLLLNESNYALCFFSQLNSDKYTRRVFEIPATGCLLVTQHSKEMETFYKADQEVVMFKNRGDLLDKIKYLERNVSEMNDMAEAGYLRCTNSGYDVDSRIEEMVDCIRQYM